MDFLHQIFNVIDLNPPSQQVDAQTTQTSTTANSTTANGGGFMVLPGVLSLILPAGLVMSLLHDLRCWTSRTGEILSNNGWSHTQRAELSKFLSRGGKDVPWPTGDLPSVDLKESLFGEKFVQWPKNLRNEALLEMSCPWNLLSSSDAQEIKLCWLRQIKNWPVHSISVYTPLGLDHESLNAILH